VATSGTTAFSSTARDLVTDALDENGILPLGEDPTAAELDKCLRRLNAMLKSWQMQGALWKQETIEQTITAATATIALPTYVRGVNGARYVESATNERQMVRFERDEYNVLPNKAAAGSSTIFYVQRAEDALVLHVWPVPTSNNAIKLDIDRAMDTVTNAGETVDFPEELTETVYANLAVRCCAIFQKEPSAELMIRAQILERQMLDNYRPASYFMEAY
jgi:hypothetical protein